MCATRWEGIATNKPLTGLGWRMKTYMNICLGTASLYYFLLITYYFILFIAYAHFS